jgi:energy-coupling factor transporter transmembrane protein EcfT
MRLEQEVRRKEEGGRRKENSPAIKILIHFLLFILVFIIINFQLSIIN